MTANYAAYAHLLLLALSVTGLIFVGVFVHPLVAFMLFSFLVIPYVLFLSVQDANRPWVVSRSVKKFKNR
ncbi:hypothetical protein [Halovenus halobia]|uniref:hypothetical protein n=1 Tax=Halovenus halobia TaxID=3396622 RepID=UPI003F566893